MSKSRNLGTVFHQWGGGTATFFAYTHCSHDLSIGLLAALLPLIRESLGLNYLQSGIILSSLTITMGFSQLPGGWLGDRLSRRAVIAVGMGGVGLATIAVGSSTAYYPMIAILVIMGIFAGAYHPSAVPLLYSFSDKARIGRAIAIHMVGGSIGFAIGPVLGGLIADWLGWHSAFIILGIPALVAVPLVLKRFRQQKPTDIGGQANQSFKADDFTLQPKHQDISIGQALKPIAIVFALIILTQFVNGSAMAFIPIYLVDRHNIAPAYAAMLTSIIRGGGIAGSLFGGWLSDRWGRKKAISLALVAAGPILYLLTRLPFNGWLIVIFILFGLVSLMRPAVFQPFLMENTPPQFRATIFGLYFGLGMEGTSLLQPVAGYFMDVFSIVEVFNVIALISVGLSLAALLLAKRLEFQNNLKATF